MTTACILSELSYLGVKLKGAYYIAKRLQERKCPHASRKGEKAMVSAAECIQSMVGEYGNWFVFPVHQVIQESTTKSITVWLVKTLGCKDILESYRVRPVDSKI